jgi:hypothetical protein
MFHAKTSQTHDIYQLNYVLNTLDLERSCGTSKK